MIVIFLLGGNGLESGDLVKENVKRNFGLHAEEFVISESHEKGPDLPFIIDWLQPESHWIVLDVATGGGHVAKMLSPHVKQVVAVDITYAMLQAAAKHLRNSGATNVLLMEADAEHLPFLDVSFDAVTCRIAAHHFPDPLQFVKEVARVLKPGGKLILTDNVSPENVSYADFINAVEKLRDTSHVRYARVSEWEEWMQDAGLTILHQRTRYKNHPFTQWVARTTETPEQFREVERLVLGADEETKDHFHTSIVDGQVLSLDVEEWMALAVKPDLYSV